VEDLKGYVVRLPKSAKYAQILKNSVAQNETVNERIFLMKDLAAVEEAIGLVRGYTMEQVRSNLSNFYRYLFLLNRKRTKNCPYSRGGSTITMIETSIYPGLLSY
jgi:hypothetical protein